MNLPELLACPFCGGESFCSDYTGDSGGGRISCTTNGCYSKMVYTNAKSKQKAIIAWNRRPALAAELAGLREDAERLDALQAMTKGYGIGWVLRESRSGRGMRLHETNTGTAFATVRAAIDSAIERKG